MVFFYNKIITLNSAYGSKQNGTLSSFVLFNFNGLLKEETHILRSYISVVSAQIPVSFYTINATNNALTYIYIMVLIQMLDILLQLHLEIIMQLV